VSREVDRQWLVEAAEDANGAASCRAFQTAYDCHGLVRLPAREGVKQPSQLPRDIVMHGFVATGSGSLVANGVTQEIQPTTLFRVQPGVVYSIHSDGEQEMILHLTQRRLLPHELAWPPVPAAPSW